MRSPKETLYKILVILWLMGGKVSVASIIGQGSTFHLRLPDVPISARLPASAIPPVVNEVDFNILHQSTLLVVDDNEINCQLIAEMFDGSHHRLIFAPNGEEAVAKASEIKPSIVLLDVRMPGMGGREALLKIRKLVGLELIPIIAVTASNLKSEEISLKERFSGYVRKPFSKRELFDELAQFLASRPIKKTSKNGTVPARPNVPPPPELISQLERLIIDPWPSIRDSLAINEIKIFAQGLEGLGERWHCEPIVIYARKLLADAENYALIDLEKHLGQFALLVEELKNEPQT
jgi:CheY-like chemotaxis protein